MAAYATVEDVQARMVRTMSEDEEAVCGVLLDDSAAMIDAVALNATAEAKKVVSCRMVIRALGDGSASGYPIGASQGSMSGLGYSQSWTVSGGSTGELYIGKADRQLLGLSNSIGSYSPVQELAPQEATS
jgi:hypothetical protein